MSWVCNMKLKSHFFIYFLMIFLIFRFSVFNSHIKKNNYFLPCITVQGTAHCVLLGPNYAMTKTSLSWDTSQFDESYASSQWQKIMIFNPEALKDKPKKLFSAAPSLGCAHFGPIKALGTSQLVPISSPGTSCC